MQQSNLGIIMKKREIKKKLVLAKTRTARKSCWVKKGRTNGWWEKFITNKVSESNRMSRKSFYELCYMLRPYIEKKRTCGRIPISVEGQVSSFLYYINGDGR